MAPDFLFLPLLLMAVQHRGFTLQEPVEESSSANSPYVEVPCDMRPLSGWKDDEGNLWGVGSSDLWRYNVSSLSWSNIPLPNVTSVDIWRVACGRSGSHLVVMGRRDAYLLYLSRMEWRRVGAPLPRGNRSALWCRNSTLLFMDLTQSALYTLNAERAKWSLKAKTPEILHAFRRLTHETFKYSVTWFDDQGALYLFLESPSNSSAGSLGSLWSTFLANISWSQVAVQDPEDDPWPDLHTEAVTWAADGALWLWKLGADDEQLWRFDLATVKWQQVALREPGRHHPSHRTVQGGISLTKRLVAWTSDGQLCVLTTQGSCAREYVPGTTWCLHMGEEGAANTSSNFLAINGSEDLIEEVEEDTPTITEKAGSKTATPTTVKSVTPKTDGNSSSVVTLSWGEFVTTPTTEGSPVSVVATINGQWPHSSVFGSVIFFGTSLTIFALVGVVWCVRRCVHFPKEALLLRDPPSVRYTAIPDTIA